MVPLRALCALLIGVICVNGGTNQAGKDFLAENAKKPGVRETTSGLQYKVLKSGPEGAPSPNRTTPCECHYRGTLLDGTEFDSSYSRGKPTTFAPSQVIKGWTEAMQLMREGDKWELTIPAELAYGDSGAGSKIPGGSVLIFELEILKVNASGDGWQWQNFLLIGVVLLLMQGQPLLKKLFGTSTGGKPSVTLEAARKEEDPRVFFEVSIGGEVAGQVEMRLFQSICPKTVENFRCLCTGEKGKGRSGKPLHYKGSKFHRIIPGFMCQGGDFTHGSGAGGESIYGSKFDDEWEQGVINHSQRFLLSMANRGPNTNGSQFFLTVAKTPHLDGKHVVFGEVVGGEEIVKKMEAAGSGGGSTKEAVEITDCGEMKNKST